MQSKYLVFVAFLGLAGCSNSDPNDDLDGDTDQTDADLSDTDLTDTDTTDTDAGDTGPTTCTPGTKACCYKYADDTLACQGTSLESCYGETCENTTGGTHGKVKAVVRAYCNSQGVLMEDGACPACTTVPDTGNGGGAIASCFICDQEPTCSVTNGCLSPCDQ